MRRMVRVKLQSDVGRVRFVAESNTSDPSIRYRGLGTFGGAFSCAASRALASVCPGHTHGFSRVPTERGGGVRAPSQITSEETYAARDQFGAFRWPLSVQFLTTHVFGPERVEALRASLAETGPEADNACAEVERLRSDLDVIRKRIRRLVTTWRRRSRIARSRRTSGPGSRSLGL
jgi:hypothetical protein